MPTAGRVADQPRVGYAPERFPPALPFSGQDYLMHLGRAHGLRGAILVTGVEDYVARFGAADYVGTPLRHLSKAMCQKIAIGQALLARPGLPGKAECPGVPLARTKPPPMQGLSGAGFRALAGQAGRVSDHGQQRHRVVAAGPGLGPVDGHPLAVFQAQNLRGQRELPNHSRVPERLALTAFVP
jgi:hypothetical protein